MNRAPTEIKAAAFDALAHPPRLKILEKLRQGPCCVRKIIPFIGAVQSNVSHHLAILKSAGLVRSQKRGPEVWYAVGDRRSYDVVNVLDKCIIGHSRRNHNLLRVLAYTKE